MRIQDITELTTWGPPAAIAFGGLVLGVALRRLVLPVFKRMAAKSTWKYDDLLVYAVNGPVVIWGLLLGLRIALKTLPLSSEVYDSLTNWVLVLGILSVAWAVARFASASLTMRMSQGAVPGVSLLVNLVRVVIFTIGVLMVLDTLGIKITGIITALGVGGLAVGLALQDTLANFFAGIRILAAGKIRSGDFIRLEGGQEGYVEDITWGQTTIRQLSNNIVIVPNAKISTAIITNFTLPDNTQSVSVPVGVAYGSDLEFVERVTLDVATTLQKESPFAFTTFEPAVRYQAFGDSAMTFNVVLRARSYEDRGVLQHEFVKRLYARYAREKIEIPFPVRTVLMKKDG